jgi:predicted CopG family antitoxin
MSEREDNKNFKAISISKANYDKIFEMGVNWSTSFNDIVTDLIDKASTNIKSSAAAAKVDEK